MNFFEKKPKKNRPNYPHTPKMKKYFYIYAKMNP